MHGADADDDMSVVLPTEVLAATNVAYLDADGNTKTASSATEITDSTSELTSGWYVVNTDVTRTGTIKVTGEVHLILADGCNLTVTGDERKAGINVNGANRLTIYDQAGHTGVLNVTGDQGGAGIGSGYNKESGGFITINGGIINATGGDGDYKNSSGAGIGDGGNSDGIKIIINGGEIIATGGGGDEYGSWTGAGIGGHESDITITGGKITATGGKNKDGLEVKGGAGIGGSGKADVNTIIISGGTVTATGGPKAAGVGGGEMGVGGVITISGGVVNATGSDYPGIGGFAMGGAGIGSGAGPNDDDGEDKTTITISGTSTVTATGAFGSAGIGTGTGAESNHSATITIDGGTVTGIGGVGGAGIGGGLMLDGGTITIKNGTVTATGGEGISGEELTIFGGTGIGGGSGASMGDFTIPSGSGGTANISGGLVFAKGDDSAKDIGGALDSSGGSLAISGTAAVFLRNDSSVEPVDTTTHTHKNIGNHVANTTAFGIPVSWDGDFGAWLLPQLYAVTVNSGTGGGDFAEGDTVTITANAPATGKVFDKWTTADGVTFGDANNVTTTFVMPAKAVSVTATYKDAPVTTYAVTVNSGTGSGNFAAGATVSITANAPATGKVFDKWTTSDDVTFGDANKATTTFVMPAKAVTVTATYKNNPEPVVPDPTDPEKPVDPDPEKFSYKIIKGANGKWDKTSKAGLEFISNGDFDKFEEVKVDGKTIDKKHYSAKAGSTIVTLKDSLLSTLGKGDHSLTLEFEDGKVETKFTILEKETLPKTGDAVYPTMLFGFILLLAGVFMCRRREA